MTVVAGKHEELSWDWYWDWVWDWYWVGRLRTHGRTSCVSWLDIVLQDSMLTVSISTQCHASIVSCPVFVCLSVCLSVTSQHCIRS